MTNITIRQIAGDEMLDITYRMDAYAFHSSPPLIDKLQWQDVARKRKGVTSIALFEDDRPLAVAASTSMTQHVRGAMFGEGGIWGVVTHPSAPSMLSQRGATNRKASRIRSRVGGSRI